MATVDNTGIETRGLDAIKTLLEQRFQSSFGQDLSLDPETPQGQFIGIAALSIAEMEEHLVSVSNGTSPRFGRGKQLDDNGDLINVPRKAGTHTTVTATLGGESGSVIPAGSRAATPAGDYFTLDVDATVASTGAVEAGMTAEQPGPIEVGAGELTRIITLRTGWETVTNNNAGEPGKTLESDTVYRARYREVTDRLGIGTTAAIRAAMLLTDGVTHARVEDNDTSSDKTTQGLTVGANSVMAVVSGGTDSDVADTLKKTKVAGIGTSGNTTSGGVSFQRVTKTAAKVAVETTIDSSFSGDGVGRIKDGLVAYAEANWGVGEAINASRLYTPINAVPGHTVTSLTVTDTSDTAFGTTDLNILYTLAKANVAVTTA